MTNLSYDEAAHMFRRMGFGGHKDDINDLVARGREGAVDYLINYEAIDNSALDSTFRPIDYANFFQLQKMWVSRMIRTRRPFQEKLVLFWHNHFATARTKVDLSVLMYIQNETLRQHALDRFDTLLLKVSQDPAMLVWLDGLTNAAGRPNLNFARELQELFSMGINDVVTGEANYTEKDVQEIARAFTGWGYKLKKKNKDYAVFKLKGADHDNGVKEVYGQSANFSGQDIITIICARRATARFLVKKLFDFFVYPLTSSPQDKATIEKFADVYMASDHSFKATARAIFASDEFFSDRARFALIKNPLELILGTIHMLDMPFDTPAAAGNNNYYVRSQAMGLEIFNPPDVGGWELDLGWINTATLLERYNFANDLLSRRALSSAEFGVPVVTIELLRRFTDASPQKTVENFLFALGPLKVSPETLGILTDYLQTNDAGERVEFVVDDATIDKTVRGLVRLIMCLPHYQLN
ncbi:MAG TPA: DUF1800 domain-containing protein [Blastocatellia bacterium]|nr:DUF1800 domain-containing protein [Blastocatellia bacterium]